MSNRRQYVPEFVNVGSICFFFYRGLRKLTPPIRRKGSRIGRNRPCECGSGKKFKYCCGRG